MGKVKTWCQRMDTNQPLEVVLFNPAKVPTTRYRYRGAVIPAAWPVTG